MMTSVKHWSSCWWLVTRGGSWVWGSEFAEIQSKNRSLCDKAVAGIWDGCTLLVISSCQYQTVVKVKLNHSIYVQPLLYQAKFSPDENVSLLQQIVFIYFVFSCTSSSLVEGLPVKVNSRSSRLPRSAQNSNDLDGVFPNPTITQKGQLYSRTGYFLVILPNGTIQTTLNNSSIYSK